MKRSQLLLIVLVILTNSAAGKIINGPYLQNVNTHSITIMWLTDDRTAGEVHYSENGNNRIKKGNPVQLMQEAIWIYEITLTELEPGQKYQYFVVCQKDTTENYYFQTEAESHYFRCVVYGDNRHKRNHEAVARGILESSPDLIFNTGDLVHSGEEFDDWQIDFFNQAECFLPKIPFFPVIGNHENTGDGPLYFQQLFSVPQNGFNEKYYYIDYQDARFIVLDKYSGYHTSQDDQFLWLENTLQNTKKSWIFVLTHEPPYSSAAKNKIDEQARYSIVPLFEKYGVDMVFNAHAHSYERSVKEGIHYVVTAGGGAELRPLNVTPNPYQVVAKSVFHHCLLEISPDSLDFQAIDVSGDVFDSFTIYKRPAVAVSSSFLDFDTETVTRELEISNNGVGTVNWEATLEPKSDWITLVTPVQGTLADGNKSKIVVSVNRDSLAEGEYSGRINILSNGGGAAIIVRMIVAREFPFISVTPTKLNFSATGNGKNPAVKLVSVSNKGTGILNWTATEIPELPWLNLNRLTNSSGEQLEIFAKVSNLQPGIYSGVVQISEPKASNSPLNIPISLIITATPNNLFFVLFEAEASPSLPNPAWEIVTNAQEKCLLAVAKSRQAPRLKDRLDYEFEVPDEINEVFVFAEIDVNASNGDDSFWLGINGGDICNWKNLEILGDGWKRAWVCHNEQDSKHGFKVKRGKNTLNLYPRADGGYINWLAVTADPNFEFSSFCRNANPGKAIPPAETAANRSAPQAFQLNPNFPNPFNPVTTISFTIPRDCQVKLTVFNELGQQVAEITNGFLKTGHYEFIWKANNQTGNLLKSGIFFCKLQAGRFVEVRKMILLK